MADFTPLLTNFKDDILASSNSKRKYNMIHNSDGTVSFEDVTVYSQQGSEFGAKEVNEEREAINKLNTDIGLKTYDLVWQDWITPYTSTATVVAGICIVSLCFEIKSPVGQFTNLGVVEVPGVKAKAYVNTPLTAQGDGRCVDCLIDPSDEKPGYIYINARGLEFPANTVFRGQLVYPVYRTIVL